MSSKSVCLQCVNLFYRETRTPMKIDDAVFQVGEGEDKAIMFSKCKMSLAKQVSFALFTYLDSVLALGYDKVSANTAS